MKISLPFTAYLSDTYPATLRVCLSTSSLPYSTPKALKSPPPASSTPTLTLAPSRMPLRLWSPPPRRRARRWAPTFFSSHERGKSKSPTLPIKPPAAATARDMVTRHPSASTTILSAPSAGYIIGKQNTVAPTQPAPRRVTYARSPTAVPPLPPTVPIAEMTILPPTLHALLAPNAYKVISPPWPRPSPRTPRGG